MTIVRWRCSFATVFLVLLIAVILVAPHCSLSQRLQGTIIGDVTDPNQAAVAGAIVTAKSQETDSTRDTVTNAQGGYTVASLPPGTYTVTVKAPGFASYIKTGIVVNANETTRSDVILVVGRVNQSVTVSAQASVLQSDRADVRSDLTSQTLNNLPLPLGRNYQMIIAAVVPGVSPPQSGQSFGANPGRAVGFSVNGASSVTNSDRIDGTSSTNYNAPDKPMYSPALEAIDNVNVVTNSPDAEQGIAGGAAVNITTKAGTNAIHGSLFEYHSDRDFQAYAWGANGALPKPKYINNQFGGTIGGPIKKDRLFYFVSYQGTYVTVGNILFTENPTPAMKTGNLSASPTPIYDPLTGKANGTGRKPFPGNIIPQSRIDPGIRAVLNFAAWPNPNTTGTGSLGLSRNYQATGTSGENQNQWDSKLY